MPTENPEVPEDEITEPKTYASEPPENQDSAQDDDE